MKFAPFFALMLTLVAANAQAASLKEIFQSIADATEPGNGNGHSVSTLRGKFNEEREVAKIRKLVHKDNSGTNDCLYDVYAAIDGGLQEIEYTFSSPATAKRLAGLVNKNAILQIVYSQWDGVSGDSEYCLMSTMHVYGVDGSVLQFDFNETD